MNEVLKYDVVVIGSGPGGQKAAVQASKNGRRVAMIERERKVGGACVYQGTIPSKTLRESALTIARLKRSASAFDFQLRPGTEVASLMTRLDEVLNAHDRFISEQLESNGIHLLHGRAKFAGPRELQVTAVDGQVKRLGAEIVVVATGSRPRTPPGIPVDHEHVLDSDSILSMIYLPRSLTVLGGGVIASEYASIFSLLGAEVTMVDKAPRPLMFLEPELTERFLKNFQRHGGRYLGEQQIKSVVWDGRTQVLTTLDSGEILRSDKLLVALGRMANIEGLGLEAAGITPTPRGFIGVNADYQTCVPHIYAVGDVIGPPSLASCSMEQGRRAICHAFQLDPGQPFEIVPLGIYAVPEMASVGLTEEQARAQHGQVTVGRASFDELARGQISGAEDGLLKLVADGEGKKLLGVQIVGDSAADLIHVGEMALINGNEVSVFLENILNFPTLGEAYRVAALNLINAVKQRARELAQAA